MKKLFKFFKYEFTKENIKITFFIIFGLIILMILIRGYTGFINWMGFRDPVFAAFAILLILMLLLNISEQKEEE